MKLLSCFVFIFACLSFANVGCVGAVPESKVRKLAAASQADNGADAIGDTGLGNDTLSENQPLADPNTTVPVDPPVTEEPQIGRPALPDRSGRPAMPTLRWIAMGDFGERVLTQFNECATQQNLQRAPCTVQNEKCISSFETSCSAPEGCRRLFKCTTGQNNTLAWFPMGDGTTLSDAQNASPAYGLCSSNSDIAGSECRAVNSRCLSSFCTSGAGNSCGRRTFKCLTTGVAGQFFYRWMGDKSEAELASVGECALQRNIAGSECFTENSTCKSSFVTANGSRRLFKCTP